MRLVMGTWSSYREREIVEQIEVSRVRIAAYISFRLTHGLTKIRLRPVDEADAFSGIDFFNISVFWP